MKTERPSNQETLNLQIGRNVRSGALDIRDRAPKPVDFADQRQDGRVRTKPSTESQAADLRGLELDGAASLKDSVRDATGARHIPNANRLVADLKLILLQLQANDFDLEPELSEPLGAILREELVRIEYMSLLLRGQSL